jgi:hypothetical protein
MGIINVTPGQTGLVGVLPSIAYINTDDTIAEVTTTGYLNKEVANGLQISLPCIAAVSTKATPTSAPQVGWYQVSHVGANWSLVIGSNEVIALPNGQILVGNASGIATAVAMSGDATIANTGALTIAANAITTAKILDANVTLAKLAAGITPSHIIKFANQVTTVGGAAAEAFTVTGAVGATDRAFVQVVNDGTANVTVLQAVVTNNTLTVTFSADPGNDAVINYQIIRVAS